jgi:c-di-GMP-related signal transduction protein
MNDVDPRLGREPIVNAQGQLIGFNLSCAAPALDARREPGGMVLDASTQAVLGQVASLLKNAGRDPVIGPHKGFIPVDARSLADGDSLDDVLQRLSPQATVLSLAPDCKPRAQTVERLVQLRDRGFGVAARADQSAAERSAWLDVATHLKVDIRRLDAQSEAVLLPTLHYGSQVLIAESVDTAEAARHCIDLGFQALQGNQVGPVETLSRVRIGIDHELARAVLRRLAAGAGIDELDSMIRGDVALCWRLLRYVRTANFGLHVPVRSLWHALELVGRARLERWIGLLLSSVEDLSPIAARLAHGAALRGRALELMGRDYFEVQERGNLFLTGAFATLPAVTLRPMAEAVQAIALPSAVVDALVDGTGPYGALLSLVRALEQDRHQDITALGESLSMSPVVLDRARRLMDGLQACPQMSASNQGVRA